MTRSENETNILPNLTIDGVCNASGGRYDMVSLDGVGKINGAVFSRSFRANGQLKVLGDLETQEMNCDGMLTVKGRMQVSRANVEGMLTIEESLVGEQMTVQGFLKVKQDCEIERFEAQGAFHVEGLLNAGTLEVGLHGLCKAAEIGVESLRVRKISKNKWNLLRMFSKFNPELQATVIEGDDLDLEFTRADIVRGNRVMIGEGCQIGRVEYRSELLKHPRAIVGEEEKLGD